MQGAWPRRARSAGRLVRASVAVLRFGMSNPLRRFFRSFGKGEPPRGLPDPQLERKLEALEAEIEEADAGFKGIPLNRAGDLCMRAGDKERALGYLGRAIDAYLEDEQPEAARAVAQKLIRLHPRAIRTLCTITWLDLAAGHLGDALLHLGEYVEAARRGERREICRDQILEMARVVDDPQFRSTAAKGLEDLDFPEDAAAVRGWIDAGEGPEGAETTQELRALCFAAAVGANEEE